MAGRIIIITGASDGIGASAARALAAAGERVVIVGRSAEKTAAVAAELGADYHLADFSRLDDVRALAETLLERYPRIDVLTNNAGGLMGDRTLTADGHELTFQVNHLAPFLLTTLLLDRLVESGATVINTASIANRLFGDIDLDDLENERRYTPNKAYGDAKLANILTVRELDRRYRSRGLTAVAFHPGIVSTGFGLDGGGPLRLVYGLLGRFMLSPARGADTLVWLALGRPTADWIPGEYYSRRRLDRRRNSQVDDTALASALWERSAAMVEVPA
jgi:NAD(P)-dependent dehydrogenase (short-subunit alcohol dehydrogenase family)